MTREIGGPEFGGASAQMNPLPQDPRPRDSLESGSPRGCFYRMLEAEWQSWS